LPAWLQHLDQISKREQIGHPERGSAGSDDHKRIVRDYVGPTSRDLPQPAGVVVEIDAMASKAVAARNELVLPSEQRVVRMRDPDSVTRAGGIGCS
jgi:hypothetical protein